jgi:hypothetical protein
MAALAMPLDPMICVSNAKVMLGPLLPPNAR